MVSTVGETSNASSIDGPAIYDELIGDSTDSALATPLGTTTRDEIDARTPALIGHLERLLVEDLGADSDDMVKELYRRAYKLLDLRHRPTPDTPAFAAYFFMRDVAGLARRLLWIYSQRSGTGVS
ncbi:MULTISPECIES: hypothetical protein [Streptomyces]|uniref:hypothetical protein n=1 Tax=Streptomyces TaxID=1883 RepID=UPI001E65971B|nr:MULTISPECIES: hypothetical protein [Streptomyces]UFQ15835.1 hypothetical protein J2N69_12985 [Streptomyces huasconensis]WCL85439.1 hypothetical protein PPN52_12995 [Streptomyces sp. JCM 35825]